GAAGLLPRPAGARRSPEPLAKRAHRLAAMGDLRLRLGLELGDRRAVRAEKGVRIVAEAAGAPRGHADHDVPAAVEAAELLGVDAGPREHADVVRWALGQPTRGQFGDQAAVVVRVAGPVTGEPGTPHARSAVQRVDAEAGVVGQDPAVPRLSGRAQPGGDAL